MNHWYFWVLAPVMLGTAVSIVVATEPTTFMGELIAYLFSGGLILATLGLARPDKFGWSLRIVAGLICLACAGYLGSEVRAYMDGKPFGWGGRRSETSLRNAILAFIVFGLPAAQYVFSGRSDSVIDSIHEEDEDEEDKEYNK